MGEQRALYTTHTPHSQLVTEEVVVAKWLLCGCYGNARVNYEVEQLNSGYNWLPWRYDTMGGRFLVHPNVFFRTIEIILPCIRYFSFKRLRSSFLVRKSHLSSR